MVPRTRSRARAHRYHRGDAAPQRYDVVRPQERAVTGQYRFDRL